MRPQSLVINLTSRSIISLGAGASGLSPVLSIGMLSFLISFSMYRSFLSISSHRRTSLTNLRWKALTSGLSCRRNKSISTSHYVETSLSVRGIWREAVHLGTEQDQSLQVQKRMNRPTQTVKTADIKPSPHFALGHPSWPTKYQERWITNEKNEDQEDLRSYLFKYQKL